MTASGWLFVGTHGALAVWIAIREWQVRRLRRESAARSEQIWACEGELNRIHAKARASGMGEQELLDSVVSALDVLRDERTASERSEPD